MKHWDKYDLGGVFDVFDFDKKMALINLDMIYEYAVKLDIIVSEESQLEDWVKMKLTRIEQNVSDVAHSLEGWEKFDEGGMIFKKQLLSISKYAHKLIEMIKGGSKLMSWQENKLAVSANDIDNLYHHLDYKVGNRASQKKFATGGMMKYPDLSNETPIVINEPNNQKISEIDIALIDIALVRKDLGIEKTKIGSSDDAYRIFKQLWNKDSINVREEMNVLFLNNANEPIGYYEHTKGAINSTLVDVEMIAALALKTLSKGVILAHNHPSGNNKPSEADIKLYQQVKTALKMFNVTVLDSMILVPNSDNYYSLADNGYEMGGSLSFERGGSVYRIVEGYDHYKGMPLYHVIGDNDYVGEYHTDRKDAEKELQELIGGVVENIKSYRYGFDTYIQVDGTNYGGKLVLGRGKVRGKENVYLSHIDWDENNVPENSEEIEEYVDKNLNNLLQNAQQYNNGGGVGIKFYALWSDGMRNKKRQEILYVSYWKGKETKHQPTLENIKEFLSQVPFDEIIAIYTDDDTSFYGELHSAYTPLYTAGAESVDAIVDSNDNIIWNKYERSKYFLNPSDYMENGGGVGEYKVGDTFIGTPNAKYDESWQLFKPSTSYVIDNKTNKIISIHNTPYDAIVERDNTNPNFKTHFKVYPKEHYKETGGGVGEIEMELKLIKKKYPNAKVSYFFAKNPNGKNYVVQAKENGKIVYSSYQNKYVNGGGINSDRDNLFKSQEPHEQRYKRKREWKEYKKEGWFGDWYEMGGNVSSELSEPQKEFSKSAEMLVRENLQNGEICMCKLRKILGHEPNYPKQVVGSLVLEKAYLRNFYKI